MPHRNKRRNKKSLFKLSLTATILLFAANLTGFLDTVTASTEGCGKYWPLCNGSILPPFGSINGIIEYGHRLNVLTAAVTLLLLSISAWIRYDSNRKVRGAIAAAAAGVVLESALGALSVFYVNPPALMATHMGVALITFGSLIVLTVAIREADESGASSAKRSRTGFMRLAWFTLIYLYLAIYFGAYVASTGDGAMFQGLFFPTEAYSWAHETLFLDIAHRSIALGMTVLCVALAVTARRMRQARRDLSVGSRISVALVLLQAASGMLLVYTHLSLTAYMLHVTFVTLLFGTVCYLGVQSMREPALKLRLVKRQRASRKSLHSIPTAETGSQG